jgi:lipid-binding SYLF domain-containing protein
MLPVRSELQGHRTKTDLGELPLKRLSIALVVHLVIGFGLAGVLRAQSTAPLAPSASEIDRKVTNALNSLYANNPKAQQLGAKAKGILVFPDIKKGAFLIGAQFGFGALRKRGRTAGYYRTAAASYGFQAGAKEFGYALFFMTNSALDYLNQSGGWALGTGPSIVVLDQGAARSLSTTSMRSDVYAFVFDQSGLMGGMGIEGSKITQITPPS